MISIIIPTLNEEKNIGSLVRFMLDNKVKQVSEIIVVDGGSSDNTIEVAQAAGAIVLESQKKGRAVQMNYGASVAKGTILYFVHADVLPPKCFQDDIIKALENNFDCGRFCTQLDSKRPSVKLMASFSRFDWLACYGGDQTFFITRKLFDAIGGYNNEMCIMEDYDITQRAKLIGRYTVIPKKVLVSARKYEKNSWYKVQRVHYKVMKMYLKGAAQTELMRAYKTLF